MEPLLVDDPQFLEGQIPMSGVVKQEGPQMAVARSKAKSRRKDDIGTEDPSKRRCVSTACIACRRRKSKCDGNLPACAACSSVYNTECIYDPNSDHRRKGVYKKDDKPKTRNSTLEVLIQAILNVPEDEVPDLVRQIRTCESLDAVAEAILTKELITQADQDAFLAIEDDAAQSPTFETQLSSKVGELRVEDGSARYIGGTSNLIVLGDGVANRPFESNPLQNPYAEQYTDKDLVITSWTKVTDDPELIIHLLNMYFTWHYTYFTTLSKSLFYRDFYNGCPPPGVQRKREYCTPLLVNAMLALGCHFTGWPAARENREDSSTAGDHFFKEAKRIIMVNDEYEKPKLTTIQALALMSVREAGCGRESKGWVYSGMSFRMACDLGLNVDFGALGRNSGLDEEEIDARRITFWGCFLFDKCWSNYLGRFPQLPLAIVTVPKFEVFPVEDSEIWAAYTDSGFNQSHAQPARTRAVAMQISALCEISADLMSNFYNPIHIEKSKGKQVELKKLGDIHQRLEEWRRNLPVEMEPKEGGLPSMLVMHMFFQLLYIHLFRPFLKYSQATSPLPPSVSPRRLCTQAATAISKLLRLYKRSHGLRQICNIAVYIANSACTIHLFNLPDKNARRDITHGVKHLEEIAESWLCARRTLAILSVLSRQWKLELPEEVSAVFTRTDTKFAAWNQDIQPRDPSKVGSVSPPQNPLIIGQILQPSPFLLGTLSNTDISPIVNDLSPISTTEVLPPHSASARDLQGTQLAATSDMAATISEPSLQQQPFSSGTPSVSRTRASPSTLFGGVEQLLRDSQDWWVKDQHQLATGFGQWPREMDWLNTATTTEAMAATTASASASTSASVGSNSPAPGTFGTTDMALAGLFSSINRNLNSGGMNYPNESEWYQ